MLKPYDDWGAKMKQWKIKMTSPCWVVVISKRKPYSTVEIKLEKGDIVDDDVLLGIICHVNGGHLSLLPKNDVEFSKYAEEYAQGVIVNNKVDVRLDVDYVSDDDEYVVYSFDCPICKKEDAVITLDEPEWEFLKHKTEFDCEACSSEFRIVSKIQDGVLEYVVEINRIRV